MPAECRGVTTPPLPHAAWGGMGEGWVRGRRSAAHYTVLQIENGGGQSSAHDVDAVSKRLDGDVQARWQSRLGISPAHTSVGWFRTLRCKRAHRPRGTAIACLPKPKVRDDFDASHLFSRPKEGISAADSMFPLAHRSSRST